METVRSADGTQIAFRRSGSGPPLVLVHGSTADHTRWAGVLPDLERAFTVIAMDRRGRGASGDGDHYALEREFEDVAAVVGAAGSKVDLVGHSFGALCALEAALRVENLRRLVLYEPVFPVGDAPLYPPALRDRLWALVQAGDRETALTSFFRDVVGLPETQIAALRADPSWKSRIASVHTAIRELADGDYRFRADRFGGLNLPVLLLVGEKSPKPLRAPSTVLAAALADARISEMRGQGHIAMTTAPDLFLSEITGFLSA
ncbi:MAG: alpha/beta hydrolase [Rhodobacteraceae bacterium]|nr:alpha/beta hydrolase [Paracoccaceae bacterium]